MLYSFKLRQLLENISQKKIRSTCAYVLKNNKLILFIFNYYYKLKNRNEFFLQIEKRGKLSLFEYQELAKPIPFCPIEKVKDSNYYGYAAALKKYTGLKTLPFSIEHGLYLGSYVPKASYYRTIRSIITFSENRKSHLREGGIEKKIVPIGPYIHYAEPLLDDQSFQKLKLELGRVLLVFPSHSSLEELSKVDIQPFILEIKQLSKGFDTVLTCMYYIDILNNNCCQSYIDAGFKIVTAGNIFDVNFIRRLKSIILLADFTVSNSIGTHLGYCVYLEKPHYIYKQKVNYVSTTNPNIILPRSRNWNTNQLITLDQERDEIYKYFSSISLVITDEQRNCADKYWGMTSLRSTDELRQLLTS